MNKGKSSRVLGSITSLAVCGEFPVLRMSKSSSQVLPQGHGTKSLTMGTDGKKRTSIYSDVYSQLVPHLQWLTHEWITQDKLIKKTLISIRQKYYAMIIGWPLAFSYSVKLPRIVHIARKQEMNDNCSLALYTQRWSKFGFLDSDIKLKALWTNSAFWFDLSDS